jgi:predicted O-linked N-acetylglucosamine transferase (SPINDLY family)
VSAKSTPHPLSLAQLIESVNLLMQQGQAQQAASLYQEWIAKDRTVLRKYALYNLAVLLSDLQDNEQARSAYEQALALDSEFHQARINLGSLLERMGQADLAIETWRYTASIAQADPAWEEDWSLRAMNQMGRLLEQQKQYAQAEDILRASLLRSPKQPDVLQHYLHLRQRQCHWPVTEPLPGVSMNDMLMAMSPLSMLAYSNDPAMQLLCARNFVSRKLNHVEKQLAPARGVYRHERVRIGYLSGDLCTHAVGLLLAQVFEHHDRSRFEVFAFDHSPEDGSAQRRRLLLAFEHVYLVRDRSDDEVAQLIRSCEIDVLVDLHGLSLGLRSGVLAQRPAPVQATYLGFIGTTAMPWIDYVISDACALPAQLAPYYTEQIVHLDGCFLPADAQRRQDIPKLSRAQEGLPEHGRVLGAFNNSYKINRPVVDLWVRILKAVPDSVLWLVDDNPEATRGLKEHLMAQGLSQDRLVFSGRAASQHYLGRLALMDLFLDCFPYNAGSTGRDVLLAGTPLLTLEGHTFVSRMGSSLLSHLGLHELVTRSPDEYVQRAIELCAQPSMLMDMRRRIADISASSSPGPEFTRGLEQALLDMHHGKVSQKFSDEIDLFT